MGRIWMKLYVGWHESDWLSVLAPESRLSWILLLERVKTHGDGGALKKSNYDDLARRWNVGVEHIRAMVKAAVMDGAIEEDETHWVVTAWSEYQEDRTNADRQKRYRDRQKLQGLGERNVTLQTERNVTGRGEERRIEENISLDEFAGDGVRIGVRSNSTNPRAIEPLWNEFLSHYPARKGDLSKAKGKEKFTRLIGAGEDFNAIITGVTRYSDFLKSTEKFGTEFVKQIPTFLNNRTWEEDFKVNLGSARKVKDASEVHLAR